MTDKDTRDQRVQSQYESYPYPARDPEDERQRLVMGSPSNFAEINHYVFGGRRNLTAPFSALVAGGGTGDAAIMLAQNLTDLGVPGEVTHLDLSEASQAVARTRAEIRGLTNLRFVRGSLLDLENLAPGPWDYIDCCGVLHHLDDPEAGLATLARHLAPAGGIGVMVYGTLGRTGVYHMQDMLDAIAPGDKLDDESRVGLAKRLGKALPTTAWLNRNGQMNDHLSGGDAGLYDLFLHARDRSYTVPEITDWVSGAELRLTSFIEPFRYDPAWLVNDPRLIKRLEPLDPMARAAFAERFTGNLKKHVFYAVRQDNTTTPPGADHPEAVPVLINTDASTFAAQIPTGGKIDITTDGLKLTMTVPSLARMIVGLCDGQRSLADIHTAVQTKRSEIDYAAFARQFESLYRVLNAINTMVLRLPPECDA